MNAQWKGMGRRGDTTESNRHKVASAKGTRNIAEKKYYANSSVPFQTGTFLSIWEIIRNFHCVCATNLTFFFLKKKKEKKNEEKFYSLRKAKSPARQK